MPKPKRNQTITLLAALLLTAALTSQAVPGRAQTPVATADETGSGTYFSDPQATDAHCGYTDETTSGPYFITGTPETATLNAQNVAGTPITVSGSVYDGSTAKHIPNAQLNVWGADSKGQYAPPASGKAADFDPTQLNLRGIVSTDANGKYQFSTLEPGQYGNRRRHLHYFITAEGYIPFFTQTYWKDDTATTDSTDLNTEACRMLTFARDEQGVSAATFDIYMRPLSMAATPSAAVTAQPFTLVNLNTATDEQIMGIPGLSARMLREFKEYRPYVSIQQFRKEIGKYVGAAQVAEYEKYVYVPVDVNNADLATLKQIPGIDDQLAAAISAARPFASAQAFLDKLAAALTPGQVAYAKNYLDTQSP